MQSLIAVIFKEDMDRAEAYRVELRGREELAGLVDCSKMVAAVCDKKERYTSNIRTPSPRTAR